MTFCAKKGRSGNTMAPPSMSTNAVTSSTTSLPMRPLVARLAKCRWRPASAHHARHRDDGQDVRNHRHELRRNDLRSLQLDLQRLRGGEQQASYTRTQRVPASKDNRRKGDEPASRRHRIGELMLVERQ